MLRGPFKPPRAPLAPRLLRFVTIAWTLFGGCVTLSLQQSSLSAAWVLAPKRSLEYDKPQPRAGR